MKNGSWLRGLVALLAASCAGVSPPHTDAPVALPTASATASAIGPVPESSATEEPRTIVAVGRVHPEIVAQEQPSLDEMRQPLRHVAPTLPPALGAQVLAQAPLEFAVGLRSLLTLSGKVLLTTVSIPLRSFDEAVTLLQTEGRSWGLKVAVRSAGVYAVIAENEEDRAYWLVASAGSAPARLLVGSSEEALEEFGLYLARGLPLRDLGNDPIVIEASPRKVIQQQGRTLQNLAPALSWLLGSSAGSLQQLLELRLTDLVQEGSALLEDVEHLRIAVQTQSGSLLLTATANLPAPQSWAGRSLQSIAARPQSARDLFQRLPADTELAWISSGPEPTRTEELRAAVVSWLSEYLGPGTRVETLDLIARAFFPRSPFVFAQGDASGQDGLPAPRTGRALWTQTLATFGWHLLGFDEPAKEFEPKLDAGMDAYNSGDLRNLAYQYLPYLCPGLGKIVKKTNPKGLPAGSAVYEMKMPGKFFDDCMAHYSWVSPQPAPTESLIVVLMPDGNRTWIGFGPQGSRGRERVRQDASGGVRVEYGPEENRMVERVAAILKPTSPRVKMESELSLLQSDRVRLGGFVSGEGVGGLVRFLTMREHPRWARQRVATYPQLGRKRMPFALEVSTGLPVQIRLRALVDAVTVQRLWDDR